MAEKLNKDITYRSAKPQDKDYTINDGNGLCLLVKKSGSKLWRFIYRYQGKQNRLSFGAYPATTLESAREHAATARQQLAENIDPSTVRKKEKSQAKNERRNADREKQGLPALGSFADIAGQWLGSIEHLTKPTTLDKKKSRLERLVFPVIGDKPVNEVKSSDVLSIIKPIVEKGQLETAHRVRSEISSIYAYAIVHDHADYDPAQPVAKQIPAQKVKHHAAIIDPREVGQLLRDIYNYHGTFVVRCALRLSALLFQRPGEIRQMLWDDIDLTACEWRPFVSKTDFNHIVPLSRQAVEVLESLKPLTGHDIYVLPSSRADGRPMSDGTVITALKTLGYSSSQMTAHGFRSLASTLLNEQGWSPDAIERQLAHAPRDEVRAAYNRAQYLEERRRMMQAWADYLDSLRSGAEVIPIRKHV